MITKHELEIANTSYTKKDFYQIYPESVELINTLTDKWSPENSNESDPGVVLVKLASFIGDKNNYSIDKNILENFMPSCTQEESMRKLCDMMGYNMHYYQSATTNISIMYVGDKLVTGENKVVLPEGTVITNDNINYILLTNDNDLGAIEFYNKNVQQSVKAIETTGLVDLTPNEDYIQLSQLDQNNIYYLPETQIASNGLFIKSFLNKDESTNISLFSEKWKLVNNLNDQPLRSLVYKFGYDSKRKLPYIQFPNDISNLINGGLSIKYLRTSGSNGNISANTLTKINSTTTYKIVSSDEITEEQIEDTNGNQVFVLKNINASNNGTDKETIDEAYVGFKKTIGTFDTLVTCRDYSNAIYNLVNNETDNIPLVSNIQVSDIRNDLNNSSKIVTYNENGLVYKDKAKVEDGKELISHFDLVLYPFTSITTSYDDKVFINSFKPDYSNNYKIENELESYKTIAHNFTYPSTNIMQDMYCIKIYYSLDAKIVTNYKVNSTDEKDILKNIKLALYKSFNSRNIDFGEEIDYNEVLKTIENADTRIKNVSLNDFELTPYIMFGDGSEVELKLASNASDLNNHGSKEYIDLLTRNILANRIPLFNYNNAIKFNYNQSKFSTFDLIYGYYGKGTEAQNNKKLTAISTYFELPTNLIKNNNVYTLKKNEVIQMLSPNISTNITYPYGVNYAFIPGEASATIKSDVDYALKENDILYIQYKESETNKDNIIIYTKDTTSINGIIQANTKSLIIRPSGFDLINTTTITKTPTKILTINGQEVKFYTLNTNDTIELRKFVTNTITSNLKCSWLIKNGESKLFEDNSTTRMLESNEYFFYTDDTESSLVILGSGTILKRANTNINFELADTSINIENVANQGIGAFSNENWTIVRLSDTNNLTIEEMEIVSLGEGDSITNVSFVDSSTSTLSNALIDISGASYKFKDDENFSTLSVKPENYSWQIRSRLNLNVSPSSSQILTDYHKVKLTLQDNTIVDNIKAINASNQPSIYCNYTLQHIGDEDISLKTTTVSDDTYTETNNTLLYICEETPIQYNNGSTNIILNLDNLSDIYTKIDLSTFKSMDLIIPIPSNSYAIIMFYINNPNDNIVLNTNVGSIALFNTSSTTISRTLNLKDGLNIVTIKADTNVDTSITLNIKNNADNIKNNLIIQNLDIIKTSDTNTLGLNLKGFGVDEALGNDVGTIILNNIKQYSIENNNDIFYYNAPSNNNLLLESNMNDTLVWFDYNNMFNRFVLSELDIESFSNINIAKSSKAQR